MGLIGKCPNLLAAGGPATQVTRNGGIAAFESDGRKCLCYDRDPNVVSTYSLYRGLPEGSQEDEVVPRLKPWASFGVTAKGVYFMSDTRTIRFLDPGSGRVSTLVTLEKVKEVRSGGLCVSPGDRFVVWTQDDRSTSEPMLVDNFR